MDRDTFENRVFDKFDLIEERGREDHKEVMGEIKKLCNTTSEIKKEHALLKKSVDSHLKDTEKKAISKGEKIKWAMYIAAGLIITKLSGFL